MIRTALSSAALAGSDIQTIISAATSSGVQGIEWTGDGFLQPGDAEIGDLHLAIGGHHDVAGLQIAMKDAVLTGNLLTHEAPERVCAFLMPNLTVLINAFFENFMNGRDPNEVMFNRTGCFDVGHACGGWGHVTVEMRAEKRK